MYMDRFLMLPSSCASSLFFVICSCLYLIFFFFNDTATTEIYTLSLHDAFRSGQFHLLLVGFAVGQAALVGFLHEDLAGDRKSTRLNSSHLVISYAVFCLTKKYASFSWPSNET